MECPRMVLVALLFPTVAIAARMKIESRHAAKVAVRSTFAEKYPRCSQQLAALGMDLHDLLLTKEEVAKLFTQPLNCSWWESPDCKEAYAKQLSHDYFLRMTLVGQPDPRGPTLYTPMAQRAVVEEMRKVVMAMLQIGKAVPDIPFMEHVFKGINVEDTGSIKIEIINAFAHIFNRGSGDTLYRSKDVTTRPYDLSTWGDDMLHKIPKYNDLTYTDDQNRSINALELESWGFGTGKTSFVYKYPPQGIQVQLQKIIDAFIMRRESMPDLSNMVLFKSAERWIRDLVILHPFTDSNGRTARVSLNILLLMNGFSPIVMAKQDEDMTSSPDELSDRICEGMAYAKNIVKTLPDIQREIIFGEGAPSSPTPTKAVVPSNGSEVYRCCSANYQLDGGAKWCVSVPIGLQCDAYGELTQSKRYLPWQESQDCAAVTTSAGLCSDPELRAIDNIPSLGEVLLDNFKREDEADKIAGRAGTTIVNVTVYRVQPYSSPTVGNSNLGSDIGYLVYMARYFSGSGRILTKENEMIVQHAMVLKIAEDEGRAARHFIKFNKSEPDKDPKVYGIDTVGVVRGNKHFWISLPFSLKCGLGSHPGDDCAWKGRYGKTIHTACLMNMVDDGLHGTQQRFEHIYKRFRYPQSGGGEGALDTVSKLILKLFRRAFEECPNVWSATSAFLPEAHGRTHDQHRCCCFNEQGGYHPAWVKDGVCLRDVGIQNIFADMWSMRRVPEEARHHNATQCSDGMALYRIDPSRGRCLYHHDGRATMPTTVKLDGRDANSGGNSSRENQIFDNVYPGLKKTNWAVLGGQYWRKHEYVCDANLGMHHTGRLGCDCKWAGDQCR